jgi:hypothetical protein
MIRAMTQPSSIAKALSSGHGDRRIRVLAANPRGNGFRPLTFLESDVLCVAGIGEYRSALILRSDLEIPIAVSYEQLEQKLYEPDFRNDDPVLDLRAVSGEAPLPKAPANANRPIGDHAAPRIGAIMPDGTVYAGLSPDTGKEMYAAGADAPLAMTFIEAAPIATRLEAHGLKDWRVPTRNELNVLFNNRAAIGGFEINGSNPGGWYWSSSEGNGVGAWVQRLSDGNLGFRGNKDIRLSVRLVR